MSPKQAMYLGNGSPYLIIVKNVVRKVKLINVKTIHGVYCCLAFFLNEIGEFNVSKGQLERYGCFLNKTVEDVRHGECSLYYI